MGNPAADVIIQSVIDVIDFKKDTYTKIIQYFNDASMDSEIFTAPTLPNYFKLGTLLKVNELEKEIHVAGFLDFPSGYMGEGTATNVKVEKLRILYGFNSLENQGAAPIASGVAKHLITSKTMNVEEVTDLHSVIQMITIFKLYLSHGFLLLL